MGRFFRIIDVQADRMDALIRRRKLGDNASNPTCIFTERGVGYRMAGPNDLS